MDKLRFIAISGTTEVTENLYVYEYIPSAGGQPEMIVVDCGIGFPEEAAYGVDLSVPDMSYLVKNKSRLKGVLISHAHEDHFGALPFLLDTIPEAEIYTSKLVGGFIEEKLIDYGIKNKKINIIDPSGPPIKLGNFTIDPFLVTHSVPDSLGFCITTPVGKAFHIPDYKFDWTPVDQKPFDIAKAASLAAGNTLMLASDSLGATSEDYTKSELELEKNIASIIEGTKARVFLTTISSNISRIQQAINASVLHGRKVVLVGRSIRSKVEIAKNLGYINYDPSVVIQPEKAKRLQPNQITYVISGCYGQPGSALYRISVDEHEFLKTQKGDLIIFSADPAPPGTHTTTNYVVDNLIERGADVHYYDTQEDLHVSGHGSKKEIEMLFALIRPKYLIPIGGTIRHMRAYKTMAESMGWKQEDVFELRNGDVVEFTKDNAKLGEHINTKNLLVDGLGFGDVGEVVLSDRKTLAKEGVVIVVLQINKRSNDIVGTPEVISRGFVFAKQNQDFLNRAGREVAQEVRGKVKGDKSREVKRVVVEFLDHFFFEETGRRPMIVPVVVEV